MIRPMTSGVSALSGIVANGHQAIHVVSSAPSKIPYGGFSPVRLQTGLRRRRLRAPRLWAATVVTLRRGRSFRSRLAPMRHPRLLIPPPVQGSLAPPAVLLSASLIAYYDPIRPSGRHRRFYGLYRRHSAPPEVPHFTLPELANVPRSLLRWLQEPLTNPNSWPSLHPFGRGSATIISAHQITCGGLTKLQPSLHAAARSLASPALDGTSTAELAWVRSLSPTSAMTTGTFVSFLTGLTPAALAALWAAHQIKPNQTKLPCPNTSRS